MLISLCQCPDTFASKNLISFSMSLPSNCFKHNSNNFYFQVFQLALLQFADLATYLLSERASYVTGSAINLDGGLASAI